MTSVSLPTNLIIGGGADPSSGGVGNLSQLAVIYQNLISGGAQTFTATGSKTLVIDAGAIGTASVSQVGTYPLYGSEATETAAQVTANFETLKRIAAYCVANGISVQVDASLNDGATYSDGTNEAVDQWATVAAAAGLPITSVEDVSEQGIVTGTTPAMFANQATIEVNAVRTLIEDYATSSYDMTASSLAVGDMEAGNAASVPEVSEWWSAYDTAAQNAGVNSFSFVSAEMGWDAPWLSVEAGSSWQEYLSAISTLAAQNNMNLDVVVQGMLTDTTGSMFVLQQEQHAAQLALFAKSAGISVSSLLLRTWQPLPVGVNLITVPNTMSNSAAEIAATYPLYQSGSITVQGPVIVSAPGQAIVTTGSNTLLTSLCLQWAKADVNADDKLAVIIIDQTGTLTATQHGSGTVSNPSSNILVLNGNSADISAEISSLTLNEPSSGPDTIDIESFGVSGQLSDNQISVLALPNGQYSSAIDATSNQQGWISTSVLLNSGTVVSGSSVITSETLYWNTTGTLANVVPGQAAQSPFVKIDSVHEPLAEYGIKNVDTIVNGMTIDGIVDYFDATVDNPYLASGGYANNSGNELQVANQIQWASNTLKVDPFDPVAQETPFVVASTVNTFDVDSGRLEQSTDFFNPNPLSIVNFYGTAVADTFSSAFDMGGSQVTEFNTGDNPAWQAAWGSNFNSATLTYDGAGQLVEQFLQGGANQPLYSLDNVYNPQNGRLWEQFQTASPPTGYVGPTTGPLYITEFNTGDNPNWDYLDWGSKAAADTEVVSAYLITDNFIGVAFAGIGQTVSYSNGSVKGADNASANVFGSNDVISLGGNDSLNITGDNNSITGATAETVTQSGTGNTDTLGAGGTIGNTTTNASFAVIGSGIAVTAAAGDTITDCGTTNVFTFLGGGTFSEGGQGASDTVNGNAVTVWLNIAGQTIQVVGSNDVITSNINAHVTAVGNGDTVGAGSGSTVSLTGNAETVYGSNLVVNLGSVTTATLVGNGNTVTAGNRDTVNLGSNSEVTFGTNSKMGFITGSTGHYTVAASTGSQTLSGFEMAAGDRIDLTQILAGTSVSQPTLGNYVSAVHSGSNMTLAISGPNGSDSIVLNGFGAFGLQNLINGNAFVLPTHISLHERNVPWITEGQPENYEPTKSTTKRERRSGSNEANWHPSDLAAHFSRIELHLLENPKSLSDDEMLELILHIAAVEQDTRSITRMLLTKYGTLGAAIAAPAGELMAFPDLERPSVILMKLLHAATASVLRKEISKAPVISTWNQLINYLSLCIGNERVESFHLLFLDQKGVLIGDETQSCGTINHVTIYPREVVRRCLDLHASALIMVHNHPSGNPQPSPDDINMTRDVQRAAAIMGIALHDHIIVSPKGYWSFRNAQLI